MYNTIEEKLTRRTLSCLKRVKLPMSTAKDMLEAGNAVMAKKVTNAGLMVAMECYHYAGMSTEAIYLLLGERLPIEAVENHCKHFE